MYFNKRLFLEFASDDAIRSMPAITLELLDGREVFDDEIIYCQDDEECVYPVLPEWCDQIIQESLF